MYATAQTQKWVRIKEARIWLYGGIGKMVSKRAAHLHAPETCAPILNSRNKRPLQWLHWRSRSYGDRDGDRNDSARLKAERSLENRYTY